MRSTTHIWPNLTQWLIFAAVLAGCHGREPLSVNVRDPLTGITPDVTVAGRDACDDCQPRTAGTTSTSSAGIRPHPTEPPPMPRPAGTSGGIAGYRGVAGYAENGGYGGFFTPPGKPTQCGNGVVDSGEFCDSNNLNGASCSSLGYAGGGTLLCNETTCLYDTLDCRFTLTPPPDSGLDEDGGVGQGV
jgi:hypothetical protein